MARNALLSFNNSFDNRCFSKLRTLAGISPLATSASPQRSKSKAFDSKRINGIIFDCLLEMYPFAKTSLERSKSLVTTLRDIEREVSSRKSILPPESTQKNLATLRSHLEDHSKLKPEGAASLGLLCAWVLDAEFREDIVESLTRLGNDIRAELSEFTDTQTTNVSSGDLLQSEEAERGTEHE
jgi:hypothetical protein